MSLDPQLNEFLRALGELEARFPDVPFGVYYGNRYAANPEARRPKLSSAEPNWPDAGLYRSRSMATKDARGAVIDLDERGVILNDFLWERQR